VGQEEVPQYVVSVISAISTKMYLLDLMRRFGEEDFDNGTFEVHPYCWADPGDPGYVEDNYNFKWRDYKVYWYKYFARDIYANRKMDKEEALEMMEECLASLKK